MVDQPYDVPKRYEKLYEVARSGKSRKASIKMQCLHCQGFEDGAVQAVRECAAVGCPLHSVRPFQPGAPRDPNAPKGVFRGARKGEVKP